jgi:hypothetical protein
MNFIRDDELFEGYVLRPEPLHQIHGLAEGDIAIVVAVDEQHQ